MLLNFLNNGGFEMLLGGLYMAYVLIAIRIQDGRKRPTTKDTKWNWN